MIHIRTATLRDVSFIAANLRTSDREEIDCQVAPGTRPSEIAAFCLQGSQSWTVFRHGLPVGAFGFAPISDGVLNGWAFGRPGFGRCTPAITRFVFRDVLPAWFDHGIRRVEVRTIDSHASAHRWLEAAGATRCCTLEDWGRNGERFYLYAWTARTLPEAIQRRWSVRATRHMPSN